MPRTLMGTGVVVKANLARHSEFFASKYGTGNPEFDLEGRWIDISRVEGITPVRLSESGAIGAFISQKRIAQELDPKRIYDDANLWYGKIKGLGEVIHSDELSVEDLKRFVEAVDA